VADLGALYFMNGRLGARIDTGHGAITDVGGRRTALARSG